MSSELKEIEPGLHARYPVMRLTHSDRRCVHGYQTISPISADGGSLVYFEFRGSRADRSLESLEGRVVVADADGSSPRTLVETRGSSPSWTQSDDQYRPTRWQACSQWAPISPVSYPAANPTEGVRSGCSDRLGGR